MRAEVVDEHILVMIVDRVEKKNTFTPKIVERAERCVDPPRRRPDLFVGVLAFAGAHTTAGLEMPLFFSDEARRGDAPAG